MATIDIGRDAARDAAQHELSRPIYPRPSLTDRLWDWLDDLLYRVTLDGSKFPGGWLTLIVLVLLLAAAVVLAVRVARRAMGTARSGEYSLFSDQVRSAAEHRATAEQSAAQGDWAAAIRHRVRAVARALEESGVLTPVAGRTATELARDAGLSLPKFAGELSDAATTFNDVTYGGRPGTESAYRLITDLDGRLGAVAHPVPAAAASAGWTPLR